MRVSYNWLKELVDLAGISPRELAERMTQTGVAVENVEVLGIDIENVVVGKLVKIDRHPDADKLVVCQVDVAGPELIQIVTGATNVKEGDVVPVAVHGAKLPNGLKIKKSKLRGVESHGMLCSGGELGMDVAGLPEDQQHGILILPPDTKLGVDAKTVLGLDDVVLELELTPNRSDCLSMTGVAWEVAAVLGTKVTLPEVAILETKEQAQDFVKIDIADQDLSSRYVGRIVKNVRIAPAPPWMQQRLRAAGVRPISNLVDITNYVMLETGQPLHAFDYDTIGGKQIIVRRAATGEGLTTLDDNHRKLDSDMLVIADAKEPIAIAGVMGGLATEVTENTTTILLESASFSGPSIRRTSRKLGLRSEASLRFEKGINPQMCEWAVNRAVQLISQLGAGEITAGTVDTYPNPVTEKQVELRVSRVNKVLGIQLQVEEITEIMFRLGFGVTSNNGVVQVTVPTRRVDIQIEEDLIEEVARLYGYNNIPTSLPEGATTQGAKTVEQLMVDKVRLSLVESGLTEIITLSFSNPKAFDLVQLPSDSPLRNAVVIQNPLSEEQGILRTTLLPGMLEVASRNNARRTKSLRVFEIGNAFYPKETNQIPQHLLKLGAVAYGEGGSAWNQPAQPLDFYYLKGIIEALAGQVGVVFKFTRAEQNSSYHPGRTAAIWVDGEEVGVIGQLHPDVAEAYDLPEGTCACELDLTTVLSMANPVKTYRSLPKFPGMERDMALVVSKEVLAEQLLSAITEQGGTLLEEVRLFDLYEGKQIKEGYKSMAFRLKYQATDRTLTDDEVSLLQGKIGDYLAREFSAQLR